MVPFRVIACWVGLLLDSVMSLADRGALDSGVDELWLRYSAVSDPVRLADYRVMFKRVVVEIRSQTNASTRTLTQLHVCTEELASGLTKLISREIVGICCSPILAPPKEGTLLVSVDRDEQAALGAEGFSIGRSALGAVTVRAASASGALYGSFALLSSVQREDSVPDSFSSTPAMRLRIWNLWDNLNGAIERGYAGNSVIWPMALYDDAHPPPRELLYLSPCNASDPYQQWEGDTLKGDGKTSALKNKGSGECLAVSGNPVKAAPCATRGSPNDAEWVFNQTSQQIAMVKPKAVGCLDVNGGHGPEVVTWSCHDSADSDLPHQQFVVDAKGGTVRTHTNVAQGQCLTLDRSPPPPPDLPSPWQGEYKTRFEKMLRLLKSAGYNGISLTNVNSCGDNVRFLETNFLKNVTKNLGPILERFAITPYFSVCYAAPHVLSNVTSDPLSQAALRWWQDKIREFKAGMPTLGGFVVKADSEGNQGPQAFNRTEADGANMLARALRPHNSIVLWRAFVYGGDTKIGHEDRARQTYDTFMPLDGEFDDNVVVQIKHGPMDFQVREPVTPLFGGLEHTNVVMEVQATQEYTGQQIHAVGLTKAWQSYLDFDTHAHGPGSSVASILSKTSLGGMACVSNMGDWANWTGHVLSASNAYGCGRLSWDPTVNYTSINREWAMMTFPGHDQSSRNRRRVVDTVVQVLDRSWEAFEGYTSPLGIGFMCAGCNSWPSNIGCAPKTTGPGPGPEGAQCPLSMHVPHPGGLEARDDTDHYWLDPCINYANSNYSTYGIGCERTSRGTAYAAQYSPSVRDMFNDARTCPKELLLFFHNLPWSYPMPVGSGKSVPLIDFIAATHLDALREARSMANAWYSLKGLVDEGRFEGVLARFRQQLRDAAVFSEVIMGYYRNISGNISPLMFYI
eukprot:TRINITY_DN48879_c0_g1_i1.p1 TRINITY_DN48879_c0_g1~~TRINITY_DN48879_c0_g1_i1.p1  ORF type:complete len:910 (+),score=68.65 TRINITY_DN48879_c0_g1_i1:61-2790(+)